MFPGVQFLTEHVDYFNRHTLTRLPEKFMGRIGELRGCKPVTDLMGTIARIERIVIEAEEYWWYISPEPLATARGIELALEVIAGGIKCRGIEPLSYRRPEEIDRDISQEMRDKIRSLRVGGLLDNHYMENIDVSIYMSEKEVALLAFPEKTGQFDYLGFSSTDPKVLEWCKELHEYYFERAVPWQTHVGYKEA